MSFLSRYLQWLLILVCGALYGLAFAFDATVSREGGEALSSAEAFGLAWSYRDYRWLANPAAWLAAFLLAWRLWPWAALVALVAFLVAISSTVLIGLSGSVRTHGPGYWIWTASIALLFVGTLAGWWWVVPREQRRWPWEVFRGWRGVALGSWLVFSLGAVTFGWFFYDLFPSRGLSRFAAGETQVRTEIGRFDVNGIVVEIEYRVGDGYSIVSNPHFMSGRVGSNTLELRHNDFTLNGIDYGGLKPGDTLRLPLDGQPIVNGQPLAPFAIRPVRVENPPSLAPGVGAEQVRAVAWRPDQKLVVLTNDRTVQLWESTTHASPLAATTLPKESIPTRLALSPRGDRVAIGDFRGGVYLWDLGTEPALALPGPRSRIGGLAFLSAEWLLEAHGKELFARHLSGDYTTVVPLCAVREHSDKAFTLSGDGQVLARLIDGNKLQINRVAIANGTVTLSEGLALNDFPMNAAPVLNHDGSLVFALAENFSMAKDAYRGPVVIDTATGQLRCRLRWRFTPGLAIQIQSASFNSDSTLLAVGEFGSVRLYDLATGRERAWLGSAPRGKIEAPRDNLMGWVFAIAFSADGKRLAAGTGKGTLPPLMIWDVKDLLDVAKK